MPNPVHVIVGLVQVRNVFVLVTNISKMRETYRAWVITTVHEHGASLQQIGDFLATVNISRPHTSRKPVVTVVHQTDGLAVIDDLGHGDDGPEGLLAHNAHLMRRTREDPRCNVVASDGRVLKGWVCRCYVKCSLGYRILNLCFNGSLGGAGDDRPDIG